MLSAGWIVLCVCWLAWACRSPSGRRTIRAPVHHGHRSTLAGLLLEVLAVA